MLTGPKEFDLIEKFFASFPYRRKDVVLGIGDDAALIKVPEGRLLVDSTDTLVEGIHFFKGALPSAIGYKSLAVNLSDVAAMGATPCWVSLAITLPSIDEAWLEAFLQGFSSFFKTFDLQLIGGDTTRGPLSITPHVLGVADPLKILRRDAAKPGDMIYVTGTLGDAACALEALKENREPALPLLNRLYCPTPRVLEGSQLAGIANAAIDISDGLLADLNHILTCSKVGATIFPEKLPLSEEIREYIVLEKANQFALMGGDDYELCFTVSPDKKQAAETALTTVGCRYTCIGTIDTNPGLYLETANGRQVANIIGYQHF